MTEEIPLLSKNASEGCVACELPVGKIIQTVPILTPYYRTMGTDNPIECTELPIQNYTSYDLFVLHTKLQSRLYHINPNYEAVFSSSELDGVMRVTVKIFDGEELVPFDENNYRQFQNIINEIINYSPEFCLVFSSNIPLIKNGKMLPRSWIMGVLPYINIVENYQPYIDDGDIYVSLDLKGDYSTMWDILHNGIINKLYAMYNGGVVVCNWDKDHDVINRWCLDRYDRSTTSAKRSVPFELPDEIIISVDHDDHDQSFLYQPFWNDRRFAIDRVSFILERLSGNKTISIQIGNNNVRRHLVANILRKNLASFVFIRNAVEIICDNYREAVKYANLIDETVREGGRVVLLYPTGDESDKYQIEDILKQKGYQNSLLSNLQGQYKNEVSIEIYTILELDKPPLMISVLAPIHISGEKIFGATI